jgi:hypothetical protein
MAYRDHEKDRRLEQFLPDGTPRMVRMKCEKGHWQTVDMLDVVRQGRTPLCKYGHALYQGDPDR